MNGPRFIAFLKTTWWLPLLTVVAGLAGLAVYHWLDAKDYTASAQLWVGGRMRLPESGYYSEEQQNFFGTQIELLEGLVIQQRAFARARYLLPDTNALPPQVTVSQPRKTSVLLLQAHGSNAAYLEAYLNAVIDEYLNYRREFRSSSSANTLTSMGEQIARQDKALKEEQDKLLDFQKTNSAAVLQEESVSSGNYVAKLNMQLADLQLELEFLNRINGQESGPSPGGRKGLGFTNLLESLAGGEWNSDPVSPPDDQSVRLQLQWLKIQREESQLLFKSKHPRMIQIQEQIARLERLLHLMDEDQRDRLRNRKESIRLKIQSLEDAIRAWEKRISLVNLKLTDMERAKMNIQRNQSLYDRLLQMAQSMDVNASLDQESVSVMHRAVVLPSPKRLWIQAALTVMVGLCAGLGLVLGWERIDDRVLTLDDLRRLSAQRVLGRVPPLAGSLAKGEGGLDLREPLDQLFIESLRSLRSILLAAPGEVISPRSLLITSSAREEGVSFLSGHLARSLASMGRRVLLVEVSRCRPAGWAALQDDPAPGWREVLRGGQRLDKVVNTTSWPGLDLLPPGGEADSSGEGMSGAEFHRLLAEAKGVYDDVLLDCAPLADSADALVLARHVQGILLIARQGFSRLASIRKALEDFQQCQAPRVQLVLNGPFSARRGRDITKAGSRPVQPHDGPIPGDSAP